MEKRGIRGIAVVLALGLMCAVLSGCGGTGGGGGGVHGTGTMMGGSIQGTALSLADNVTTFTVTGGVFNLPIGITTDGTNLYIADANNHTIRKVVIATGVGTTLAGSAGSNGFLNATGSAARFDTPQGITTDGTNLYVADTNNNAIRKVVIATGAVTTLAGVGPLSPGFTDGNGATAEFSSPAGITTDGTSLYVADTFNNTIRKVDKVSGVVSTIAGDPTAGPGLFSDALIGTNARFDSPQGITTDGTSLFVTDALNFRIRKISTTAPYGVSTLAGTGTQGSDDGLGLTQAQFNTPYGITTDGTNLYVADSGNNTIRKVGKNSGLVETVAGDPAAGSGFLQDGVGINALFDTPEGITTDGTRLFVTDSVNNVIRAIK